jgi:putative ABC transport system permease protein
MNAIAEALEHEYPATNRNWRVQLITLSEAATANSRPILLTLLASVGLVLLIACANTASLMVSRNNSRVQEFAVRVAIGGSRPRVIRQLLTESLLLAVLGGATGLLFAAWTLSILDSRITYLGLTRIYGFRMDAVVMCFTFLVSLLAGLSFGFAPALRCSNVDLAALKSGVTAGPRRGNFLMFAEIVLTTMLLIAGAAVLKGALHLVHMGRGLDIHQVFTMQIWLPEAKYPGPQELANFYEQLLPRIRALPGVDSASIVNYPPLGLIGTSVRVDSAIRTDREQGPFVHYWVISPEYFHTVGLKLLRGRLLERQDSEQAAGSVVVSGRLAQLLFPGQDALGKPIRTLFPTNTSAFWIPHSITDRLTIVGIVPDIQEDGLQGAAQPQMYLAYRQSPTRIAHLLVRSAATRTVAREVGDEVAALDPDLPVFDVRPLESITSEAFSRQEVLAALFSAFAVLALVLAAIGIYGAVASAVSMRIREMGIRAALGATRAALLRAVISETLRPLLAGIGIGLTGAAAMNRVLSGLLAGLQTWDWMAAATVCAGLMVVAVSASFVPAWWAARVDPAAALRCD